MTVDRRRYKAVIAGKTYIITGPATQQQMSAVTRLLNEELNTIKKATPELSKEDAALLVAFNALSNQVQVASDEQLKEMESSDLTDLE